MNKPLCKSDKIAVQERQDETYVLTLADTTLHHLGDIESFIWKHIDGRVSGLDLVGLVCSEYEVSEDVAKRDVEDFISEMREAGLILEADSGAQ